MTDAVVPLETMPEDPLRALESVISDHDWPFDRSDDELTVRIRGSWCDYHLCFSWLPGLDAIHLTSAPDVRVPDRQRLAVYHLLGLMNENLMFGHFDLWSEDSVPLFRFSQLCGPDVGPPRSLCEELISLALQECERFYPALQLVLWGGKSPDEAMAACLFETVGEA